MVQISVCVCKLEGVTHSDEPTVMLSCDYWALSWHLSSRHRYEWTMWQLPKTEAKSLYHHLVAGYSIGHESFYVLSH